MREKTLNLLGLMRKANAIAVGETNTGGAVRAGKAKLLLLAADASDNARSRARGFTHVRDIVTVTLPFTKDEIAAHVGVSGCAMAAIPDGYDESAAEIQRRFEKADRRKKEAAAHEKNKRIGKRRNNV